MHAKEVILILFLILCIAFGIMYSVKRQPTAVEAWKYEDSIADTASRTESYTEPQMRRTGPRKNVSFSPLKEVAVYGKHDGKVKHIMHARV